MGIFSRKKSIRQSGMTAGLTDWHSHILPGVDDGVATIGDSLAILDAYAGMGYSRVWLTPHIMEDVPNSPDDLRRRFADLKLAYKGPIELRLAAENMLDPLFEQRLEAGDLLPIGDHADHLLVETSYINPPADFRRLLSRIKSKGYFPVLAHPERYRYMTEDDYRNLHADDIMFQLNLFSLLGVYGPEPARKASWLLRNGLADIAGSDIHRPSMLDFFDTPIASGKTLKAFAALASPSNYPS